MLLRWYVKSFPNAYYHDDLSCYRSGTRRMRLTSVLLTHLSGHLSMAEKGCYYCFLSLQASLVLSEEKIVTDSVSCLRYDNW